MLSLHEMQQSVCQILLSDVVCGCAALEIRELLEDPAASTFLNLKDENVSSENTTAMASFWIMTLALRKFLEVKGTLPYEVIHQCKLPLSFQKLAGLIDLLVNRVSFFRRQKHILRDF